MAVFIIMQVNYDPAVYIDWQFIHVVKHDKRTLLIFHSTFSFVCGYSIYMYMILLIEDLSKPNV